MPEWTPADLAGVFSGQAGPKLAQTAQHVLWYEFCECSAMATPAPPVVAPPIDIPVIQPTPLGACYQEHGEYLYDDFGGFVPLIGDAVNRRALPAGATSLRITGTVIVEGSVDGLNQGLAVAFYNAAGTLITPLTSGVNISDVSGETTESHVSTVPATAVSWYGYADGCNPGGGPCGIGRRISLDVEFYCGQPPDRLQPACCPPDPRLTAALERIEVLATLIQRQAVPFAYVPAGEVAGLTGNVELAVDGLLAVSVLLTTLPGSYGMAEGEPDAIFEAGWIAIGTVDGWQERQPLRHSPFMVRVSGDVTRVGLSLAPGVVATLRQHAREP